MHDSLQNVTFFSYETLVDRLTYASKKESKKIIFLFGSPLSAPHDGNPGVSDVDGIVETIRQNFINDKNSLEALDNELKKSSGNAYQSAISFLMGRRGQDAVNELIQVAVVGARLDKADVLEKFRASNNPDDLATELEKDRDNWFIPNCLQDLAALCVHKPKVFGSVQLTTNFDPLLSLAIQKAGGHCARSVLSKDGSLGQHQNDGCHIVHLHGYWRGSDTLHTPRQLNQLRPKLKSSLSELLRNSIVVPVAYSGWDDLFTRTLLEIVNDDVARPEVLWTYFGDNENDLVAQNSQQLKGFSGGLDSGRLCLYKGVDGRELFSDLKDNLSIKSSLYVTDGDPLTKISTKVVDVVQELSEATLGDNGSENSGSDSIPSINELVGRAYEIELLNDPQNKIVAISGIGGQGKSSLAAYYALSCKKNKKFKFIEWRDCREQNDTLQTILIRTIHSLMGADGSINTLKELSLDSLAHKLSIYFENERGLIVFDNIDHYVDLESGIALGPLKTFLDNIKPERLNSQILFTARPILKFESANAASIPLKGLAPVDARDLFTLKYNKKISEDDFSLLLDITEGHPLWITLIASRCRYQNLSPKVVLDEISSGKGTLPDRTILSIWNTLNDKQKIVLRTLAELERPLPEAEVAQIDFDINYNQFTKALKTLKALGLVELRQEDNSSEVVDLHPLIRSYIRTHFPRLEREKFISKIVLVLDRRLSALRKIFSSGFPLAVLDIWTHKVDLNLNGGNSEAAIESLVELRTPLVENGLAEEFVRLSVRVFEQVDWATLCATSARFNSLWYAACKSLAELGDFTRADIYIEKYEQSIDGKGAQFINLCNTKCYRYWIAGDFEQAIFYGEKGSSIKSSTSVDTKFDCAHNLALAWRDHGKLDAALEYFIGQFDESDVLDPNIVDAHRGGAYYGNIGRCYYLKGDIEKSLICYRKSAQLLEQSSDSALNKGYIRLWIGECLLKIGHQEDSAIFLRAALEMWNGFIPHTAESISCELESLVEKNPKLNRIIEMAPWRLENRFQQWISGHGFQVSTIQ